MSRSFPARFPGACDACDSAIQVDELVRYEEGDLVHAECAPPRPGVICPACWLVQPCDCEPTR